MCPVGGAAEARAEGGAREEAPDCLQRARQLEEGLAYNGSDAARRECAAEYLSCGRALLRGGRGGGRGGGDRAALECFEKASRIYGLHAACAEECGRQAGACQKSGAYKRAIRWYGAALGHLDGAGEGPRRNRRIARQKSALAGRCIECWDRLAAGAAAGDMDECYRIALRCEPSRARTCIQMGDMHAGGGRAEEAVACYDMALDKDSKSGEACLKAGACLEEAGRWAEAVKRYENAGARGISFAERAAAGCMRSGKALTASDMQCEAADACDAAAGMDPACALECARAHERCAGRVLGGRSREGGIQYEMAAGGGGYPPQGGLDAVRRAVRQYEAAVEWYQKWGGQGGRGEGAEGCRRCAAALAELGRDEECAAAYAAAAGMDPACALECARAHEQCGDLLRLRGGGKAGRAAGWYEEAAGWYQKWWERGGGGGGGGGGRQVPVEGAEGCRRCAAALAELGRDEECAAAYAAAAGMDPACALECARAHERCGELLLRGRQGRRGKGGGGGAGARKYEEAAKWYQKAGGGQKSDGADGCRRCAAALGGMRKAEAAAKAYAAAAEMDPSCALECARACEELAGGGGGGREAARGSGVPPKKYGWALACYRIAAESGAEKAEAHMGMARIRMNAGEYAAASQEFCSAYASDGSLRGECAAGCAECGGRLADRLEVGDAIACLEAAAQAGMMGRGECSGMYSGWGRSMFARSRHAEAARCFEAGASAGGRGTTPLLGLAAALSMSGRRDRAIALYRAARDRAADGGGRWHDAALPDGKASCAIRLALGGALLKAGMHGEAVRWYSAARAAGTDGERAGAYAGIVRALGAGSRHAWAYGVLLTAEAGGGAGHGSWGRLCAGVGAGLEEQGMRGEAVRCYEAAAAADGDIGPHCSRRCMEMGAGLEEQGMRGEAVRCYEAAAAADPGSAAARFAIAGVLAAAKEYNRAKLHYEAAGKIGGDASRARLGAALCGANALYEASKDEVNMRKKRQGYRDAELRYAAAAALSPGSPEPHMGAGRACLKQREDMGNLKRAKDHFARAISCGPGRLEAYLCAGKAVRKHAKGIKDFRRYRDALRYYDMAVKRFPRRAIIPKFWKGICLLGKEPVAGSEAGEVLAGILDHEARSGEERHYCGKACDVLGRYEEGVAHYLGSLRGNGLYSGGFHTQVKEDMIRSGGESGGPGREAAPDNRGKIMYVCDTNVVIDYIDCLAQGTPYDGGMASAFEEERCVVPQVCYNEAYGHVMGDGNRYSILQDVVERLCTVVKGRGRMDMRMQKAREVLMKAWLYSSENTVGEWCKAADRKAVWNYSRYAGGPPSGRDVLVLATAIDVYSKPAADQVGVRLVTQDKDFVVFGHHIESESGIGVVRPGDVEGR